MHFVPVQQQPGVAWPQMVATGERALTPGTARSWSRGSRGSRPSVVETHMARRPEQGARLRALRMLRRAAAVTHGDKRLRRDWSDTGRSRCPLLSTACPRTNLMPGPDQAPTRDSPRRGRRSARESRAPRVCERREEAAPPATATSLSPSARTCRDAWRLRGCDLRGDARTDQPPATGACSPGDPRAPSRDKWKS